MRVIAGEAKGRRLKAPTSGTRPMADRMREALFSALGDIEGLEVLDLYAGSGSLGLEALSRGAAHAMFVELARDAILKLQQNVDGTGLADRSEVEWGDVAAVVSRPAPRRFDLIFVDPPYGNGSGSVQRDLEALVTGGWLSDTGRIVVHRPAKEFTLDPLGLTLSWERAYGQSHIYVFNHEPEEG